MTSVRRLSEYSTAEQVRAEQEKGVFLTYAQKPPCGAFGRGKVGLDDPFLTSQKEKRYGVHSTP